MTYASSLWAWAMEHLLYINLILSVVIVFFQRRDPKTVWTWLLLLYFIPVFGFFFYLIFAQDYRKSRMFRVKEVEDRFRRSIKRQELYFQSGADPDDLLAADFSDLIYYNLEQSGAVLTANNQVEIFTDGQKKFEDLRRELRKARRFIHIQYYIIKNDELFDSIVSILKERVRAGVEVRILWDGMGGRFMPARKWRELEAAGVRTACFFPPFFGRLNLRVNYRNHRKIVVIDGHVGYVGGFNIGREYLGREPRFGYWRDTHLRIKGDAVISLQIRFALDWNYAAKENLFKDGVYFMDGRAEESGESEESCRAPLGIQIITSGPDSAQRQIRDNYLQMIHRAHHHIYIQTPYFVPDDAVLSALKMAAQSGLDVRLMIPCKPDHPFVYWATYSYVGEMLAAGARCYTYEKGFLHAKCLMTDGRVSCCGTANMDIRSFELNFEVNAMIYDGQTTERLEELFLEDLTCCREVTAEVYGARGLWVRIREQACRLLSPLL
ncbi:MAG: cardiolipin synthase [Eubacteriales bacterium]|nr:cardiolipin synthase [Eubacteriales bacterium]